eukprot:4762766-Prymnesium_polylepis.1
MRCAHPPPRRAARRTAGREPARRRWPKKTRGWPVVKPPWGKLWPLTATPSVKCTACKGNGPYGAKHWVSLPTP